MPFGFSKSFHQSIGNASPTLVSGSTLMLRASLGLTLSGSNVLVWADQSGNGNDCTPPSYSPTYNATGINGLPSVHFVGADDLSFASFTAGLTALELFVVAQNTDDGATSVAPMAFTDDTGPNLIPFATNRQILDNTGSTTLQTTGFAPAAGKWNTPWLYNVVATGSEWTAHFNGTQVYTLASNTFGYGTKRVGKGSTLAYLGDIAEVILYPAKLSDADRATNTSYLTTRYGI